MSVRRGDGSDEAERHARDRTQFYAGMRAHATGNNYQSDEGDHWRDGWIHAAEVSQQKTAVLRHLPTLRAALMGAFTLIRNAPMPRRALSYREKQKRDDVLININLALAHLPAETAEEAITCRALTTS